MTVLRSVIKGVGSALPEKILTNAEIAARVETNDEWITQRTGIKQRHVAAEGEKTSDLATKAAQAALTHAGLGIDAIDAIIVATTTPDETFPATATRVQMNLGMTRGFAFDVQAVCSGFIYALTVADQMIKGGLIRKALVIGAETMSRLLDWNDRTTCILFGDGAGAVVLQAESGKGDMNDRGILSSHLFSDGRQHDLLYVNGGPSTSKNVGSIKMQGREVFRHAVDHMADVVLHALGSNNMSIADLDWLVPHQANLRILNATAEKLSMPMEKVIVTVDKHGNTSAASIPLAIASAVSAGKFKPGQLMVLEALGGGFTWGAVLLRW
ncbi:MAG: beta-ketoacyl-ACP synthase III [Alphaproteobacteria bacterium]|nr:beta-ketoacyl-ACP synthase III [Alphaproteobacteria bacterium]